jgi:hypothetical protein
VGVRGEVVGERGVGWGREGGEGVVGVRVSEWEEGDVGVEGGVVVESG